MTAHTTTRVTVVTPAGSATIDLTPYLTRGGTWRVSVAYDRSFAYQAWNRHSNAWRESQRFVLHGRSCIPAHFADEADAQACINAFAAARARKGGAT